MLGAYRKIRFVWGGSRLFSLPNFLLFARLELISFTFDTLRVRARLQIVSKMSMQMTLWRHERKRGEETGLSDFTMQTSIRAPCVFRVLFVNLHHYSNIVRECRLSIRTTTHTHHKIWKHHTNRFHSISLVFIVSNTSFNHFEWFLMLSLSAASLSFVCLSVGAYV